MINQPVPHKESIIIHIFLLLRRILNLSCGLVCNIKWIEIGYDISLLRLDQVPVLSEYLSNQTTKDANCGHVDEKWGKGAVVSVEFLLVLVSESYWLGVHV